MLERLTFGSGFYEALGVLVCGRQKRRVRKCGGSMADGQPHKLSCLQHRNGCGHGPAVIWRPAANPQLLLYRIKWIASVRATRNTSRLINVYGLVNPQFGRCEPPIRGMKETPLLKRSPNLEVAAQIEFEHFH
jgi:hypothetical protein